MKRRIKCEDRLTDSEKEAIIKEIESKPFIPYGQYFVTNEDDTVTYKILSLPYRINVYLALRKIGDKYEK